MMMAPMTQPSHVVTAAEAKLTALKRSGGGGDSSEDLALRLTFYCNGNPFYSGRQVRVAPRSYSSLDDLLVELDRLLPPAAAPPLFGVRRLYTPAAGRQVRDIGELRDGGRYVCAGSEPFRDVGYGKTKATPWRNATGNLTGPHESNATHLPHGAVRTERSRAPTDVNRGGAHDALDRGVAVTDSSPTPFAPRLNRGIVLLPPLHFIARHLVASQRNAVAALTDSSLLRLAENQLRRASLNKTTTVLIARPGRFCSSSNRDDSRSSSRSIGSGGQGHLRKSDNVDGGSVAAIASDRVEEVGADGCSTVCMMLSRQGLQSFEALLADVSEAFGRRWRLNRVRRLYALSGREALAVADLFRDEHVFVAVGRERVSRSDLKRMVSTVLPGEPFPSALLRTLRHRYESPEQRQQEQPVQQRQRRRHRLYNEKNDDRSGNQTTTPPLTTM